MPLRSSLPGGGGVQLPPLHLPAPNWAVPVDLALRPPTHTAAPAAAVAAAAAATVELPSEAGDTAEQGEPDAPALEEGGSDGSSEAAAAAAPVEMPVDADMGEVDGPAPGAPSLTPSSSCSRLGPGQGGHVDDVGGPMPGDPAPTPAAVSCGRGSKLLDRLRDRPGGPPVLVVDLPGLQAWHQTDVSLGLPKTHVYLHLATPDVYRSPHGWVCARLYACLLEDLLEPDVYFAQLASTSYSLSCSETGLVLHFQGYSGVVMRLVQVVLEAMAVGILQPEHVTSRFGVMAGRLRQVWQVWSHNNPVAHAEYHADQLLQLPHWHVSRDSLRVLEQGLVGPEDVMAWAHGLASGSSLHVHMLVYGNVDQAEARGLADLVQHSLKPGGIIPAEWPHPKVLQLQTAAALQQALQGGQQHRGTSTSAQGTAAAGATGVVYQPPNPNPANTNSALFYLCQVGEGAPAQLEAAVLLELLVRVASKPCFHALRTQQRLGYTAGCQLHRLHGILSFAVRVQSPNHGAGVLRQRVVQWLLGFRAELQGLPLERLEHFKAALKERYEEPPKSLADAASQAWLPIRRRTLDFGTLQMKAAAVSRVTLQDLVNFYDSYIAPGGCTRTLSCEVQGGQLSAASTAASTASTAAAASTAASLGASNRPGAEPSAERKRARQADASMAGRAGLCGNDEGPPCVMRVEDPRQAQQQLTPFPLASSL